MLLKVIKNFIKYSQEVLLMRKKIMLLKEFIKEKGKDIFLLILACIYIISPTDVISEGQLAGVLPYFDDILVFILACLKSYSMGKGQS
jgi:uncharacterized membrane protein YkvA (DUF1232 family)